MTQTFGGVQRRNNLSKMTPAEIAIFNAMQAVEHVGAHPMLTEVVMMLHDARNKLADYVELPLAD